MTDDDDTDGPLDIVRVGDRTVQFDRHEFVVSYRVRTTGAFSDARLARRQRNLVLELNVDDERGSERNVLIAADEGRLVAEVISNATRQVIGQVDVSRPNDHTVRILGPRRLIGARSYFWTSNFHARGSARCGQRDGFPVVCQDSVPDRGWIRLERPSWPEL